MREADDEWHLFRGTPGLYPQPFPVSYVDERFRHDLICCDDFMQSMLIF